MGRPVDIAINHNPGAVAMHEVNHPTTCHFCESVWRVDPREVCAGQPVGLAWFSPDCKHHSKARGGKPVEKHIRGLAWVAIRWAATVRPRVIILENVEEFVDWGPLVLVDGEHRPCKKRRGQTFRSFVNALRRQGYEVEYRELRACDYGAPTIRKRFFLVARCDGQPIVWPEPTHADPKSPAVALGMVKPWRTAAECIDWSLPCPSIFERARPLAEATLNRIAKGVMRYVVESSDPFVVPLTHPGHRGNHTTRGNRGELALAAPAIIPIAHYNGSISAHSVRTPLRTVMAQPKGGHFALVSAFLAKHYTGAVGQPLAEPLGTVTSIDHHSLVSAFVVRQFGKSVGSAANHPVGTVTAGGGGKTLIAATHLVKLRGTCRDGQPVTAPMPTQTAGGTHVGEVRTFLLKYNNTDQRPDLRQPMHTVTTRERFGLVMVAGEEYRIVDIGLRMLSPRELYRAQGFPEDYIIDRDAHGKPFTKTEQVEKCGNSVPPPLAEAITRANMVVAPALLERGCPAIRAVRK